MRPALCSLIALLMAAAGPVGCQSPATASRSGSKRTLSAVARPARTAGLSTTELRQASRLFVAKCARCHALYDPAAYTDAEWRSWMTKMSNKARLKPDQEQLLSRYLEAFRTGG